MGLFDEVMDVLDGILPKEDGSTPATASTVSSGTECPTCKKKTPTITLSCSCKFVLTACAACATVAKSEIRQQVRNHIAESDCEAAGSLLAFLDRD
jgi:hypothetical protein